MLKPDSLKEVADSKRDLQVEMFALLMLKANTTAADHLDSFWQALDERDVLDFLKAGHVSLLERFRKATSVYRCALNVRRWRVGTR
jgi:hypothetical protein